MLSALFSNNTVKKTAVKKSETKKQKTKSVKKHEDKKPMKQIITKEKNNNKQAALNDLKLTLNSIFFKNFVQTYDNNAFREGKDIILHKTKHDKKEPRPHYNALRPYTKKEKEHILEVMKSYSANNIYKASVLEKTDFYDLMFSQGIHYNTQKSYEQNLNTLLNLKDRKTVINLLYKFCKMKELVLYGGIAINIYVTTFDKKFNLYPNINNQNFDELDNIFPDFDVFSMTAFEDLKEFAKILKKNGLSKIEIKRAKHDNTWKLYVNFLQVADFTVPENPIPYKVIGGIRYATVDFLKAGLYKASADASGGYFRWLKDAKRLEKLKYAEQKSVRKFGSLYTYFSNKSPFQRFISTFYGPLSGASLKTSGNKKWNNKEKENLLKSKYIVKNGNYIFKNGKKIQLKEGMLQHLKNPTNGSYVPWLNEKKSYKIK